MTKLKDSLLIDIITNIKDFDKCITGMDEGINEVDVCKKSNMIYMNFPYIYTDDRESTYNLCNNKVQRLKTKIGETLEIDSNLIYINFNRKDAYPNGTSLYSCTIETEELKSIEKYIE